MRTDKSATADAASRRNTWRSGIVAALLHVFFFLFSSQLPAALSSAVEKLRLELSTIMSHLIHEAINLQNAEAEKKAASKFKPATPPCITLQGPLPCPTQPSHPAIAFIGKYLFRVDSLDASGGPYHEYYAPAAKGYGADGSVYEGGDAIWNALWTFLNQFEEVEQVVRKSTAFETKNDVTRAHGSEGTDRKAWLVMLEVDTRFWLKDKLAGPVIVVPQMLQYLVGPREWGYGTDNMQILQAKAWWDTTTLKDEIRARQDTDVASREREQR